MNQFDGNAPTPSKAYPQDLITFEQYLALEDEAQYKNEFEKGKVIEMSGGTYRHSRIAAKLISVAQPKITTKQVIFSFALPSLN